MYTLEAELIRICHPIHPKLEWLTISNWSQEEQRCLTYRYKTSFIHDSYDKVESRAILVVWPDKNIFYIKKGIDPSFLDEFIEYIGSRYYFFEQCIIKSYIHFKTNGQEVLLPYTTIFKQ